MPAPDPAGLNIDEYEDGGFRIGCEIWAHGNRAHRLKRLQMCGKPDAQKACAMRTPDPIPTFRREAGTTGIGPKRGWISEKTEVLQVKSLPATGHGESTFTAIYNWIT